MGLVASREGKLRSFPWKVLQERPIDRDLNILNPVIGPAGEGDLALQFWTVHREGNCRGKERKKHKEGDKQDKGLHA